jgi:hypothetical protein
MAQVPNPRSYQQILGDMVDTFESKFGIPTLKVGSPLLRTFEAAAMSDFRSSNDIFALLRAQDLDQATGAALLLIAADENLTPIAESQASGPVQITDTSFTKKSTKIFQGQAAPIVGSTTAYVQDASSFPASGAIYIGRGTTNYEGPLTYSARTNLGTYWSLTLATATQRFHNFGETVILAQGGDRTISAGTQVQTPQGNAQDAVQFATLYAATIPDGETTIENVQVVAKRPGLVGNITAGAISSFTNAPFSGASVTNTVPFTNANAQESEDALRERIRNTRQSRSRGTPLAITTGVTGLTSPDENKRVVSASVVSRAGYPTTLYIDDGTGYEERDTGVAFETLVASAIGGEQYFTVASAPPVAKAFVTSSISAPFNLTEGCELAVIISGLTYTHAFPGDDFRAIGNATAYEVVASINGDPDFPVSARTASSGTKVVLFAKQDADETIQVTTPASGDDANQFFNFPTTPVQTMALFKNDRLLSKDGRSAVVKSNAQGGWGNFSGDQDFTINVDGTGSATYTLTDADFINADTGYTTLNSTNSLASWAAVFNARVPGITCSVADGGLTIVSNRGNSAVASLAISGCDLVTNGMFSIPSTETTLHSEGADNDYSLDRNRGEIYLAEPLAVGDTLSIGTVDTRAFIQSDTISSITLASDAELWFAVDGNAQIVRTGVLPSSAVQLAAFALTPPDASHVRVRVTVTPTVTGGVFSNVQENDWVIFLDSAFSASNRGAWRVSLVANDHSYLEICRPALTIPETVSLTGNGLVVVRTRAYLQKATVTAATNYTATSLALALAGQLSGATVLTYKTNYLRIRTNTEGSSGDIALVATNPVGLLLTLPVSSAVAGVTPDAGYAESGNSEAGTPQFTAPQVLAVTDRDTFTVSSAAGVSVDSGKQLVFLRDLSDINSAAPYARAGSNLGFNSAIESIASDTTINLRNPVLVEFINKGRFYSASPLATGPLDTLTVLVDGDAASKRYSTNVFRRIKPTTSTYGITNQFTDADNSNQALASAFGLDFNFVDYALFMKARTKSHASAGDTTKTVLWRWWRHGPATNAQLMKYVYPIAASQGVTATTDSSSALASVAQVRLASGAARAGATARSTTKVGVTVATSGSNQLVTYFLGLSIASASRTSSVTTLTVDFTGTNATDHGFQTNDVVYIKSTNINFASGAYTITRTSASTFTYAESASNQGSTPAIGTVSFDTAGEATLTGSTIVNGDVLYVLPEAGLSNAAFAVPGKTSTLAAQYWKTTLPTSVGTSTVIAWGLLNSASNFIAYPLNGTANTAANIASAINALAAQANSTCPVTAVAVGNGVSNTGTITAATYEDSDSSSIAVGYTFTDGVKYVRSEVMPATSSDNYTFTFKSGVTASLATNSDWQNEDVRLVPQTALNLVGWFNEPGVSGLFSAAEVVASSRAGKLQFTTLTTGSTGSVQVQGGTANSATAAVVSAASNVAGAAQLVTARTSDIDGLVPGGWCELVNASPVTKPIFNTLSSVQAIATNSNAVAAPDQANQGLLTMAVGDLWTNPASTVTDALFQFEHQGKFTSIVYAGIDGATPFSGVSEGDWVVVSAGTTSPVASSRNAGTFRVVRASTTQLWIENANSTEEVAHASIVFVGGNSVMPGDTFTLNSTSFGTNNAGQYTVVASYSGTVDGVAYANSTKQIVVTPAFPSAYSGPTVLGANNTLWQVAEGSASKLVKQLLVVSPNPLDGSLSDLKFAGTYGSERVNPVAGTVVTALDKLAFPTDLSTGTDGYAHAVGLLGAVNQTAYGDSSDPTQFPGIIAAGANINIEGPLVRRVQVSLGVRVRSGVATADIIDRVKSGVAQVINNTGIGQSIALGALVAAAQKVNGVVAVVITSPTYGSGNDLISVQPFEKALVLNLDQDVTVTLIGT